MQALGLPDLQSLACLFENLSAKFENKSPYKDFFLIRTSCLFIMIIALTKDHMSLRRCLARLFPMFTKSILYPGLIITQWVPRQHDGKLRTSCFFYYSVLCLQNVKDLLVPVKGLKQSSEFPRCCYFGKHLFQGLNCNLWTNQHWAKLCSWLHTLETSLFFFLGGGLSKEWQTFFP